MSDHVSLSEVKAHLSEYARKAEEGGVTVITTNGRAVAQLGPVGGSSDDVGSGSGWLLVHDNVATAGSLPAEFGEGDDGAADLVLQFWKDGRFESGILWVHQTSPAAVLAVPTARWDGSGAFEFFLGIDGAGGKVVHLRAWSDGTYWSKNATDFHTARKVARATGNRALGIGR